jgi:hypothetical protein
MADAARQKRQRKVMRWLRRERIHTAEGNWVGGWYLGEGGSGTAGLWVEQDNNGDISDRLVIKNVKLRHGRWENADYWVQGEVARTPR